MLDAAIAFLFHRGDERPIADEHGGDVAVIRVQSDDVHDDICGMDGASVPRAGCATMPANLAWK